MPRGRIEFIEPNAYGAIDNLELQFHEAETKRVASLMHAVWQHVVELRFPSVEQYPATLTGIKQFEKDLIDKII